MNHQFIKIPKLHFSNTFKAQACLSYISKSIQARLLVFESTNNYSAFSLRSLTDSKQTDLHWETEFLKDDFFIMSFSLFNFHSKSFSISFSHAIAQIFWIPSVRTIHREIPKIVFNAFFLQRK